MMSSNEPISILSGGAVASCSGDARITSALRKLGGCAAIVVAKLREVAPYAAIELVLPGGSVIALLLWFYRRRKKDRADSPFDWPRSRAFGAARNLAA